jgi:hypothetical protein
VTGLILARMDSPVPCQIPLQYQRDCPSLFFCPYLINKVFLQVDFSYDWISLIADVGGWTGTLIGLRYNNLKNDLYYLFIYSIGF